MSFINFFWFVILLLFVCIEAEENVKTWIPNNDIYNKDNWVDPTAIKDDCGLVEFDKINTADIFVDKLTAKEFILPVSGKLVILDGGYLEVVSSTRRKKTDCMKLKSLRWHHYLDSENWYSDSSKNPAVPDAEKIPCTFDKIKFPNGIHSAVATVGLPVGSSVSGIEFGNETLETMDFDAFQSSDIGIGVFEEGSSDKIDLTISEKSCTDSNGCECNEIKRWVCTEREITVECQNPITPDGFCYDICGASIQFTSTSSFSLEKIKNRLKKYENVLTHVSKLSQKLYQVVFTENKYTGDSIVSAKEFFEVLKENSEEFGVRLKSSQLKLSGSQTNGDSSLFFVFIMSLLFVLGIYTVIFMVYGDNNNIRRIINRLSSPSSLPLSSTYRARFNPRDDENDLIIENQSMAGSIVNLEQSFDNPLYGQVSTAPDMKDEEKNIIYEPDVTRNPSHAYSAGVPAYHQGSTKGDPLNDIKKLNEELQEEIGSDVLQETTIIDCVSQCVKNFDNLTDVGGGPPLIEIGNEEDNIEIS